MADRQICKEHNVVVSRCRCMCKITSEKVDCPSYCPGRKAANASEKKD